MKMRLTGWTSLHLEDGTELRPGADGLFDVPEASVEYVRGHGGIEAGSEEAAADETATDEGSADETATTKPKRYAKKK